MPILALSGLSFAFAWAVFHNGGAEARDWRMSMFVIGAVSLFYFLLVPRHDQAPPLRPVLRWSLLGLIAYGGMQTIPLPLPLIAALSPARAEAARTYAAAAGAPEQWITLSVVPATSVEQVLRVAACIMTVLLVRELCWRLDGKDWLAAMPLVIAAAVQAGMGLAQYYSGAPPARGSYVNRNHFAGLLEMTAPFGMLYPAVVIRNSRIRWHAPARPAILAALAGGAALLILVALLHSLSRMGFIAGLVAVLVAALGLIRVLRRDSFEYRRRIPRPAAALVMAAVTLGALVFFVYLAPDDLIKRFGAIRTFDVEDRPELWREVLPLVRDYMTTGCGLGGFESAFMRYKKSGVMYTDDFAHNDYLQYLGELGLIGFCVGAAAMMAFGGTAVRAAASHATFRGRCLAVACIAAFAAIGFHSAVDFNLYVPANSMLLAWIAGIASGVPLSSHPAPSPQVVELATVS